MVQMWFEVFKFAFECFEFGSNVRIYIRMLEVPFEFVEFTLECSETLLQSFKFAFECFKSLSNGSKLHLNALKPFQIV